MLWPPSPMLPLSRAATPLLPRATTPPSPPRCAPPRADLTLIPPGGVGKLFELFSTTALLEGGAFAAVLGVAFLVRSGRTPTYWSEDVSTPDDEQRDRDLTAALCRAEGWLIRCEINGEKSSVLRPSGSRRGVGLDFRLAFEAGELPYFGTCALQKSSRYLANTGGRWRIDGAPRDDARVFEFRVRTTSDITSDDDTLVAAGTPLYFSAVLAEADEDAVRRAAILSGSAETGRLQLTEGQVAILENDGPWGPELNLATGSARLVQVGVFEATAGTSKCGVLGSPVDAYT